MIYSEVDWQVTPCRLCPADRVNVCELLYDDEPLCVECADLLLERQQALALASPEVRARLLGLPAIGDR